MGRSGIPAGYAIIGGNITVAPKADGDLTVTYYGKIPSLTAAAPTNWLLDKAADVYLYALVTEIAIWAKDFDGAQAAQQLMSLALSGLSIQDERARWGNAQVVVGGVCDIVSLDRFSSVYGSVNPNAQTMVAMAQEAGDEIARRADWERMLKQQTAAASPETLATDYQRMTPGGAVRTSAGLFHRPITNSSQWAVIVGVPSTQPYFFIKGNQVLFSPGASAVGAIIEY
eukprot:gene47079-57655_t